MSTINLNILQERELARLLDYERATCSVQGELTYRCAFPYRPDDDLQCELIERGALITRKDGQRGTVVLISSDGYSYFPAQTREREERLRAQRRDAKLIGLSAFFAALCVVVGFALGYLVA